MPTAYPATNFHTENIAQFVADVDKATRRQAQDHRARQRARCSRRRRSSARCRAARRRSARSCSSNFENEDPLFGVDGVPFLATSYAEALKLYKASRKALEEQLAKQGMKLLYTVPWPPQGIYTNKPLNSRRRHEGPQVARLQPGHVADRRAGRRAAGDRAGGRAVAGARHRRRRPYMSSGATGYDSKTYEQHQVLLRHAGLAAEERGHREQEGVRRARQGRRRPRCSRPRPTPRRAAGSCPRRRTAGTSSSSRRRA